MPSIIVKFKKTVRGAVFSYSITTTFILQKQEFLQFSKTILTAEK